jgi:hypothetical protein
MTITYTWEFTKFKAHQTLNGLNNVVYNIDYIYTGSDGEGHAAQVAGNVGLGAPDPSTFVEFDQLTESQVISMVENALTFALPNFQQTITDRIAQQISPVTVELGKPWTVSTSTVG